MFDRLKKALSYPKIALAYLMAQSRLMRMTGDERYIRWFWRLQMNYPLDLENPSTFNEKLQWLKLHNRRKEYTIYVDKYLVRKHIAETIGEQYLIPLIGRYDSFDQIDFASLPEQFVLKCNHGSHCSIVCHDKASFDMNAARRKFNRWMRYNWFWYGREYPYKDVRPQIIAEAYMSDDSPENRGGLSDYKFSCFNGRAANVMVCIDRERDPKFYFFDRQWNLLRLNRRGKAAPADFTLPKPAQMEEMFKIAEQLSAGIPYLRVDLYYVNQRIYFGEMTFFPASGYDPNLLPETDAAFGSMIDLKPHA